MLSICNETAHEYIKRKVNNMQEGELDHAKILHDLEQDALEKSLQECNKVALLLPDDLSRHVARKMINFENYYAGKEPLQQYVLGFKLKGYVPVKLLGKLKTIIWVGIWDRWNNLHGFNQK